MNSIRREKPLAFLETESGVEVEDELLLLEGVPVGMSRD